MLIKLSQTPLWCRVRSEHFRFSAVRTIRYDQESVQTPPIGPPHAARHQLHCFFPIALMRPTRSPAPSPLLPTNSASQIGPLLFCPCRLLQRLSFSARRHPTALFQKSSKVLLLANHQEVILRGRRIQSLHRIPERSPGAPVPSLPEFPQRIKPHKT